MTKEILIIFSLLLVISCEKKVFNKEICEQLSMKSFKGVPRAANDFNSNCTKYKIIFTKKKCQDALNDLIISGNLNATLEKHGKNAKGCFSVNDLNKFSKTDKELK